MTISTQTENRFKSWIDLIAGIAVLIALMIWGTATFDRVIMPLFVLKGIEIRVPDLHHMQWEDAARLCKTMKLELVTEKARIDLRVPPGRILDQFPLSGATVKPGRIIEVIVSKEALKVDVPDLSGRSPREAMLIADSLGLVLSESNFHYMYSKYAPEGVIMMQDPKAGLLVNGGDTLTISISLGEKPSQIVVPDLVGQQIDGISVTLARSNLRLGKVTRHPTKNAAPGTILEQDPSAGTLSEKVIRVNITVAAKPVTGNESNE
ncbi:PASTA domain-containing protein [Calditrichota bacterium]